MRVAVLGRGISGLAAAHFLTRAGHEVVSIDPAAAPGGFIRSERIDGFLCETGPQALLDGPAETRQLVADAGLESRVIRAAPTARRRFIHARGRLQALPEQPDRAGPVGAAQLARQAAPRCASRSCAARARR